MRTTHNNTSLKGLRACKEALDILIRGTADLKFSLDVIRTAAADNGIEIDSEAMEECGQMLSIINRLMCRQLAELKHRQLMDVTAGLAERTARTMRSKYDFIG